MNRIYKLVIVDDEKEISNGFAMFFPWKELGFSVEGQFRHGQELLEYISKSQVDLVICDVRMPGMDGLELVQKISQLTLAAKPKIIFFSAYGEFTYAQQAMQYGVMQYILKSTPYDELIAIFREIHKKMDEELGADKDCIDSEPDDQVMSAIKDYIEKHLDTVTLENLAKEVYLSPAYVSRYFKGRTGENFQDYLIMRKMKRAVVLLNDLRYRIGDISSQVGYSNAFNFTRAFKKYYGKTPKEYRQEKTGHFLPDDGGGSW